VLSSPPFHHGASRHLPTKPTGTAVPYHTSHYRNSDSDQVPGREPAIAAADAAPTTVIVVRRTRAGSARRV